METALVFDNEGRIIRYHLPPGRSGGSIPDTRDLWETLWERRAIVGGVAHTHPWNGEAWYSQTDSTTFRAVEQGLGKLLLWPVVTYTEIKYFCWNPVTGAYVPTGSPTFKETLLPGLARLRELSREGA